MLATGMDGIRQVMATQAPLVHHTQLQAAMEARFMPEIRTRPFPP